MRYYKSIEIVKNLNQLLVQLISQALKEKSLLFSNTIIKKKQVVINSRSSQEEIMRQILRIEIKEP